MIKRVQYSIVLCFLSVSFIGFTQKDSLADAFLAQKNNKEIQAEQKELNFEDFFFQALQYKAIGSFDKAIIALENCQNIKTDDKAVNFEFGKNYYELKKYFEAETFTKKALDQDIDNLFIQLLLRNIYNAQNNYKDALEIQKRIANKYGDSELDLVSLYIKNNQIDDARQVLLDLEKKGTLSDNLIPFKESLLTGEVSTPIIPTNNKPLEDQTVDELKTSYKAEKTFQILKQILSKLNAKKRYLELEKDSKEGLELFPAQPFVYLMNATALNYTKQYKKALTILESGIDYIVDDALLKADFYEQMSLSYKGLNNNVEASKYYKKAMALGQNKS